MWTIRQVTENGAFTLENVNSGKFLNVVEGGQNAFGTNVRIWDNPGSANSQWEIRLVADDIYTLRVRSGDKYLNVLGGIPDNGIDVQLWDNPQSTHCQWQIQRVV